MYPTLYHAFLDLFGVDLPVLKFFNSFGFFVALAFVAAHYTLAAELRRKTGQGLLKPTQRTIIVGEPPKVLDLILQDLMGFVLGWKGIYIITHVEKVTADPPGFLLSMQGNILAGLVVAGGLFVSARRRRHARLSPVLTLALSSMLEFMVSPLALSVLSKVQDQIDRFGAYAGFAAILGLALLNRYKTTGPAEAAFVMNELVKPATVIASHANEVGTVGGKVRPGSKTEAFIKAAKMPVHVPLSGRTMEFDAAARCTAGC